MPLLNPDGSLYSVSGSTAQYDPNSSDIALLDAQDAGSIEQGGSPIYYFEMFIQSGTTDKLYLEDRGKIFSNNPIKLFCYYEPVRSQNALTAFGIDSPDEMTFNFNKTSVIRALNGRLPRIGSRLKTPFLNEEWEIIQLNNADFQLYHVHRLQIIARRFQESVTSPVGRSTDSQPKII